jgi:hypothetical protein
VAALCTPSSPSTPSAPSKLKKADISPAIEKAPPVVTKKVVVVPSREIDPPVRTLPPRQVVVVDGPINRGPPIYRPTRFGLGYGGGGMMGRPMGFPGRRY